MKLGVLKKPSKIYVFIYFLEREGKGGRKRGRQTSNGCLFSYTPPPTGDLPHSPGMFRDQESNRRPFSSQVGVQSTEPQQSGLKKPSKYQRCLLPESPNGKGNKLNF